VEEATPHIDLGLGAAVHHQIARTGPVYRTRDRALAVVEGDPRRALAALRRALRRGALGAAVALGAMGAHAAARTTTVAALYEQQRCALGGIDGCGRAASHVRVASFLTPTDPAEKVQHFQKGCDGRDGPSCLTLAQLYRGTGGIDHDHALVAYFEYRAAQLGLCPPHTDLVRGAENVCVDSSDPRLTR
jgi:TPR repeat protein